MSKAGGRNAFVLVLLCSISLSIAASRRRRRLHNDVRGGAGVQFSAPPHTLPLNLPEAFDWRSIGGQSFVTPTRSQFVPDECGSCWAHAAVAALSDRLKWLRNGSWPDVVLSVQALLNCVGDGCDCDGGDPYKAYKFIHDNGLPDETCSAYVASVQSCTDAHYCRGPSGNAQQEFVSFFVSEYGAFFCGNATTEDSDCTVIPTCMLTTCMLTTCMLTTCMLTTCMLTTQTCVESAARALFWRGISPRVSTRIPKGTRGP